MDWIKGLIIKLIGKQLQTTIEGDLVKWGISRAKLAFVLAGLVKAAPAIAGAFGYTIPPEYLDYAYKFLLAVGLWGVRDAIQSPVQIVTAPTNPTPLN